MNDEVGLVPFGLALLVLSFLQFSSYIATRNRVSAFDFRARISYKTWLSLSAGLISICIVEIIDFYFFDDYLYFNDSVLGMLSPGILVSITSAIALAEFRENFSYKVFLIFGAGMASVCVVEIVNMEFFNDELSFTDSPSGTMIPGMMASTVTAASLWPITTDKERVFSIIERFFASILIGALVLYSFNFIDQSLLGDSIDWNDEFSRTFIVFLAISSLAWTLLSRLIGKSRLWKVLLVKKIVRFFAISVLIFAGVYEILELYGSFYTNQKISSVRLSLLLALVVPVWRIFSRVAASERAEVKRGAANRREALAFELQRRASLFRVTAYGSIVLTLIILSLAITIFVNASSITGRGEGERLVATSAAIGDELSSALSKALSGTPASFQSRLRRRLLNLDPDLWGQTIFDEAIDSDVDIDTDLLISLDRVARLSEQGGTQADSRLVEPTVSEERSSDAEVTSTPWGPFLRELPTTITRLSITALAVFLTQILVNLYRYSSRMAAFTEGRADAITFLGHKGDNTDLESITRIFGAESVQFGKEASSPSDQALALMREAFRIVGKPSEK
ncbi:MAG: hypothetical protein AAF756_19885 [Pseudomonadota bacterium]